MTLQRRGKSPCCSADDEVRRDDVFQPDAYEMFALCWVNGENDWCVRVYLCFFLFGWKSGEAVCLFWTMAMGRWISLTLTCKPCCDAMVQHTPTRDQSKTLQHTFTDKQSAEIECTIYQLREETTPAKRTRPAGGE